MVGEKYECSGPGQTNMRSWELSQLLDGIMVKVEYEWRKIQSIWFCWFKYGQQML